MKKVKNFEEKTGKPGQKGETEERHEATYD